MESLDGFWWDPRHPETRWPGTLQYGGPEGASLKLLLEPAPFSADQLRRMFSNDIREYDVLLGDTTSGEKVTLLKAFNRSTDNIFANALIVGFHADAADPLMSTAAVVFRHLDQWWDRAAISPDVSLGWPNLTLQYKESKHVGLGPPCVIHFELEIAMSKLRQTTSRERCQARHNAGMVASPSWHLFFVLPNLCPPVPSPFVTDALAICSGKDPLLELVTDTPADATSRAMLGKYRSWYGKPYVPGCVLVRSGAADAVREAETLRAFRNVCAAATISACAAKALTGGQWLPLYSDFFVFAGHVAGKSGWIQNMDGPVGGMNDDVENFVGQCAGQIDMPDAFSISADPTLLRRLLAAWDLYCLKKQRRSEFLPVFRSLEVAFHAARFPSDGLSSINDAGTRIGLWVSALEILAHPGAGGKADKEKVQLLIGRAKLKTKPLKRRRYKVFYAKRPFTVALPARIYEDLYAARNGFMHGNPVRGLDLQFWRSPKRPSLMRLAPLLYNLALRATLDRLLPSPAKLVDVQEDFFGLGVIEKGLSVALRGGLEP